MVSSKVHEGEIAAGGATAGATAEGAIAAGGATGRAKAGATVGGVPATTTITSPSGSGSHPRCARKIRAQKKERNIR